MITGTDQLTPLERRDTPDCLVEIGLAWLQRPLGGRTEAERAAAIDEICFVISQMRHRDVRVMDAERSRWVDRVTVRLCTQCPFMHGYDGAVKVQLERRVTAAMLIYHDWREHAAPPFRPLERTGPSDTGEVAA